MIRTVPALLAAALAAPALAQVVVGPVVNPANGHRYYRLAANDWAGAQAQAAAMGAKLATINDAATNAWIRANVAAADGGGAACFIGLNDAVTEGAFGWLGGDPVSYTSWGAGEPNNEDDEDAVSMIADTGLWNDVPTTGVFIPSIVEIDGPIRVPAEYPTIQAAIDAAVDGQTILVAPGTYHQTIDFGYKHLVIRSEAGARATAITPSLPNFAVIMAGGQGPETVLEGFTINGGGAAAVGVAIYDRQTIRSCRIGGFYGFGIVAGSVTISDTLVVRCNTAVEALGRTAIQNCTLVGNGFGVHAGPRLIDPTSVDVVNCIIAGNYYASAVDAGSALRVNHSLIQGGYAGQGNFSAEPLFVDAPGANGYHDLADDFNLAQGSPCIDAGSNRARVAMNAVLLPGDADGADRFADDPDTSDTGAGPGPVVDLGAFERRADAAPCLIDFNHDGFVDFFDYDDFVAAFESGC